MNGNKGDALLSQACEYIEASLQLLHSMVGSRDIETAIAAGKVTIFLIQRARDTERVKRHHGGRDELKGTE